MINNFSAILNNFVAEQKATFQTSIVIQIDKSIDWMNIDNMLKVNLFRIVQESVRKAQIYSKANKIEIFVEQDQSTILLRITDDGIGFDQNSNAEGIGIRNMRVRAAEMNADFKLT